MQCTRLGLTFTDPASTASDVYYTTCALLFVRQTSKPQLRSRLMVHAVLNFWKNADDYGTVADAVLVARGLIPSATRHCNGLQSTAWPHGARHPASPSNSHRLLWSLWTRTSPSACDVCHGHPFLCAACGDGHHITHQDITVRPPPALSCL